MAKPKKEPVLTKKALQQQIADKLQATFANLKDSVGSKKFDRHVKKASKLLATGAVKKTEKQKAAPKKTVS